MMSSFSTKMKAGLLAAVLNSRRKCIQIRLRIEVSGCEHSGWIRTVLNKEVESGLHWRLLVINGVHTDQASSYTLEL